MRLQRGVVGDDRESLHGSLTFAARVGLDCRVGRHRRALAFQHVADGRLDLLPLPQIPTAPVAAPAQPPRMIATLTIQHAAGVGFQITHDPLRPGRRCQNHMHVRRTHMRRVQRPNPVRAHFTNRFENEAATLLVEHIGLLPPVSCFGGLSAGVERQVSRTRQVVVTVHRAVFVSVEFSAVAGERDEIGDGGVVGPLCRSVARRARGHFACRLPPNSEGPPPLPPLLPRRLIAGPLTDVRGSEGAHLGPSVHWIV